MSSWHPILAAVEVEPGHWHLTAQTGPYAVVRLIDIGPERGYRAVTFIEPRTLIGYFRTFRAACTAAHRAYVDAHAPRGVVTGYASTRAPDTSATP